MSVQEILKYGTTCPFSIRKLLKTSSTALLTITALYAPYFGGIDWCTVNANNLNPANVRSPLTQINEQSGCFSRWDRNAKRVLIHMEKPDGEVWDGQAIVIP